MTKNQRQTIDCRLNRDLHLNRARLVRARAMQMQVGLEATLKFRAELRHATDVLVSRDLSLTVGRKVLAQSIERRFDAFLPIFRPSIRSTAR